MWVILFSISIRSYLRVPILKTTAKGLKKSQFSIYVSNSILSKLIKNPTVLIDYNFGSRNKKDINSLPFVSVIVPARNEEAYIERCLLSLIKQDYPYFEIIAIDDHSSDNTFKIMQKVKEQNLQLGDRLTILSSHDYEARPDDWFGKPWVSEKAFEKSKGEIILFTDVDTYHFNNHAIFATVLYMTKEKLDVLGGLPYIKLQDLLSRLVMPLWNILTLLSSDAGKVNDPSQINISNLLGSFFLIKRDVFLKVGTYGIVKDSIQEDFNLALVLKKKGFKIKLVKIDSLVTAIWARDRITLWHGIGRTIVPIAIKEMKKILFTLFSVFYMATLPFIIIFYYFFAIVVSSTNIPAYLSALAVLCGCVVICSSYIMGLTKNKEKKPFYALLSFFGALYLIIAYLNNIVPLLVKGYKMVIWKERNYKFKRY